MENLETLSASLQHVLQVLRETGIRCALAGGLAYSALVRPRATLDIDLLILLEFPGFTRALSRLEQRFDTLIVHDAPMSFHGIRILRAVGYLGPKEIIVDFLLAESEFHYHVLERALEMEFLGCHLNVVTLEDLVLLKKCADRPQDRVDIEMILTLYHEKLDHEYLTTWSQTLRLA